jgi:hypothetical protein
MRRGSKTSRIRGFLKECYPLIGNLLRDCRKVNPAAKIGPGKIFPIFSKKTVCCRYSSAKRW